MEFIKTIIKHGNNFSWNYKETIISYLSAKKKVVGNSFNSRDELWNMNCKTH